MFHETPSNGAELFHADRRTHMTRLIVAFRNSANAPDKKLQLVTLLEEDAGAVGLLAA
jgi:hypothetical protein